MTQEDVFAEIVRFAQFEGLDLRSIPHNDEVDTTLCLRFLRAVRDVSLATVDVDGLPSVRIIDIMAVTDRALYFLAPRGKTVHDDVTRTGYVAIVGMTPDFRTCRLRGRVVRPEGEASQRALVDALFDLNPGLELLYPGERRYICDAFCIESAEGEYFDLGQKPIFRRPFVLGNARAVSNVFEIGDACTSCGTCTSVCPESCIKEGSPFAIDQSHCLRCGICQESCPSRAIRRVRR